MQERLHGESHTLFPPNRSSIQGAGLSHSSQQTGRIMAVLVFRGKCNHKQGSSGQQALNFSALEAKYKSWAVRKAALPLNVLGKNPSWFWGLQQSLTSFGLCIPHSHTCLDLYMTFSPRAAPCLCSFYKDTPVLLDLEPPELSTASSSLNNICKESISK